MREVRCQITSGTAAQSSQSLSAPLAEGVYGTGKVDDRERRTGAVLSYGGSRTLWLSTGCRMRVDNHGARLEMPHLCDNRQSGSMDISLLATTCTWRATDSILTAWWTPAGISQPVWIFLAEAVHRGGGAWGRSPPTLAPSTSRLWTRVTLYSDRRACLSLLQ